MVMNHRKIKNHPPSSVLGTSALISVVARFLQFTPNTSCNCIPLFSRCRTQAQSKYIRAVQNHLYTHYRALHSIPFFTHSCTAFPIIPLLQRPPSHHQPNIQSTLHLRTPLTLSHPCILCTCANHLNTV